MLDYCCNVELAHIIFSKVKKLHPNAPDNILILYFEIEFYQLFKDVDNDLDKITIAQKLLLNNK